MLLLIAVQLTGIVVFGAFRFLVPHYHGMAESVMGGYLVCALVASVIWLLGSTRKAH